MTELAPPVPTPISTVDEIAPASNSTSTSTSPVSRSPPRGAAGFGSTSHADKPSSSRSPSRSRAEGGLGGMFRTLSRSMSRSRVTSPDPTFAPGSDEEFRSRQPRGMAGMAGSTSRPSSSSRPASRDVSRGRTAGANDSGERIGSQSRARQAVERIKELYSFAEEPTAPGQEEPWGQMGFGGNPFAKKTKKAAVEKGKGVAGEGEGERSVSRGRAGEGRGEKENVRSESRARSLARQALAGASMDRTA